MNSFETSSVNKSCTTFGAARANVNLGSNWPHYFIKEAENSATLSEEFSFQIYTKSV